MKISSVWSCSRTIDLMYLLVGNYDKNANKNVQAKSKRFYGMNGLFLCNAEYGFNPSNILIYRYLQILLLTF